MTEDTSLDWRDIIPTDEDVQLMRSRGEGYKEIARRWARMNDGRICETCTHYYPKTGCHFLPCSVTWVSNGDGFVWAECWHWVDSCTTACGQWKEREH